MHDLVIQTCRHFLRPIVRFLLRQGVLWNEFAELAKATYVEMARADYGIDGRPTNNTRVAMLTGLSRREVQRVRDLLLDVAPHDDKRKGNRMATILAGWHSDEAFTSATGEPLELAPEDFEALLARYAGDLPHTAVRKEMLTHGLAEQLDDGRMRVLQRDFVYSNLDPEIVRQMGVALHDHAATLEHNLNRERDGLPRFEGLAEDTAIPAAAVDAFEQFVAARGLTFLEDIDAWLSDHTTNEQGARTVRVGAGAYLIRSDD